MVTPAKYLTFFCWEWQKCFVIYFNCSNLFTIYFYKFVFVLYSERSSNSYPDTGALWLPFQTAAGTVTTLYKGKYIILNSIVKVNILIFLKTFYIFQQSHVKASNAAAKRHNKVAIKSVLENWPNGHVVKRDVWLGVKTCWHTWLGSLFHHWQTHTIIVGEFATCKQFASK